VRVLVRLGGGRAGAGPIVDGGCCLALVEPGAGGEHLVEPVRPERLAGWATSSAPPRRTVGHARSPARRPRASAAPISSAACSGWPPSNASRANAARHSDTLRVLWIATLRFSASSSSSLLLVTAAHSTS
jgi:hypothetical protein